MKIKKRVATNFAIKQWDKTKKKIKQREAEKVGC